MGRSSILMVIGFNVVFMTMGFNLSHVSIDAYENYIAYYNRNVARHIASSAANIAASEITFNPNWRDGFSDVEFSGGTFSVSVDNLDSGRIRLNIASAYNGEPYTVMLVLGLSKFSKFAYYSNIEGAIYWVTGDTVWGPLHTQQRLNVAGGPVFMGKATAKNGLFKSPKSSKPGFFGGFQSGIDLKLPSDFSDLTNHAASGGKTFDNENVYLRFNADGTASYRIGSWTAIPEITVPLTTLAPNGILMVNDGNLHVKGTVNGRMTISATGSSGAAKGNVWIDSSLVYADDPLANSSSNDMLGIVCDNDVVIADNSNNTNPANGVTLHASILTRSGGLKAENHNSRPISGTLTLVGGVQQYQRGPVGTFSGSGIASGFQKNYRYDDRLMIDSPPLYPTTGSYEVLSWYE